MAEFADAWTESCVAPADALAWKGPDLRPLHTGRFSKKTPIRGSLLRDGFSYKSHLMVDFEQAEMSENLRSRLSREPQPGAGTALHEQRAAEERARWPPKLTETRLQSLRHRTLIFIRSTRLETSPFMGRRKGAPLVKGL